MKQTHINQYSRFDELKVWVKQSKSYLKELETATIPAFKVNIKFIIFWREGIYN
jgi:hypothetical protein